tara:strand:- start:2518 stop:2841 length:324 start_codon:yes stop_codon:yes gene_type:complete
VNKLFLFLFILIFSSCDNRVTIIEEEEIELYYTSISVCDCYKSGMSTLSNLIERKDDVYKILFQELRMNCLTKYGSNLFVPTYCNYPDSLQMLMDSLYVLGININDI